MLKYLCRLELCSRRQLSDSGILTRGIEDQLFWLFESMGCNNSKIHSDEAVARCKARRRFMKQAVDSRHAFAASHANYVIALKAVGSALRQFAEGEVKDPAAAGTPSDAPFSSLSNPPPLPPMSLNRRSSSLSSSPHLLRHRKTSSSFQSPEIEEVSSAPPPLITPIGYDEDWKYSIQAPPSRQGQPPPPPPISQSSWRDLFLDPFRPSPGPYQYSMSTQGESSLHDTFDTNYRHGEEDHDIPDLEDVDTDGPAAKVACPPMSP